MRKPFALHNCRKDEIKPLHTFESVYTYVRARVCIQTGTWDTGGAQEMLLYSRPSYSFSDKPLASVN